MRLRNFAVAAPKDYIIIFWANYFLNMFAGGGNHIDSLSVKMCLDMHSMRDRVL